MDWDFFFPFKSYIYVYIYIYIYIHIYGGRTRDVCWYSYTVIVMVMAFI